MLELLKVICQPVLLERDQDGQVIQERFGDQAAFYSEEQFLNFMQELRKQIAAANADPDTNSQVVVPAPPRMVIP